MIKLKNLELEAGRFNHEKSLDIIEETESKLYELQKIKIPNNQLISFQESVTTPWKVQMHI